VEEDPIYRSDGGTVKCFEESTMTMFWRPVAGLSTKSVQGASRVRFAIWWGKESDREYSVLRYMNMDGDGGDDGDDGIRYACMQASVRAATPPPPPPPPPPSNPATGSQQQTTLLTASSLG
jgi:hypothetical protein